MSQDSLRAEAVSCKVFFIAVNVIPLLTVSNGDTAQVRHYVWYSCGVAVYTLTYINKRIGICYKTLRFSKRRVKGRSWALKPRRDAAWLGASPFGSRLVLKKSGWSSSKQSQGASNKGVWCWSYPLMLFCVGQDYTEHICDSETIFKMDLPITRSVS